MTDPTPTTGVRWLTWPARRLLAQARQQATILAFLPFAALLAMFLLAPVGTFLSYAFENGFAGWRELFSGPATVRTLIRTLVIAAEVTAISAVIAYLYVSALTRARPAVQALLLLAVVVPFLTSILVRSYAWIIVLANRGPLNDLLRMLFGSDSGVEMLYNRAGVLIGMVHVLAPLFILPLYAVVSQIPANLKKAARTLGANRIETFLRVTLPLSLPGAAAGTVLVFIQALGFFVTPSLLGGGQDTMVAQLMDRELSNFNDLNDAAILGTALVLAVLAGILLFRFFYPLELLFVQQATALSSSRKPKANADDAYRDAAREGKLTPLRVANALKPVRRWLTRAASALPWDAITSGAAWATAAFFVLPLLVVVPVSFTGESFLHFPPDSYSLRWYASVINDPLWRSAAVNSFIVGLLATAISGAVGLPLAFAVVRTRIADRVKGLIILLTVLPALIPIIVLAIGVFVWFLRLGAIDSRLALAASHALLGLPYLVIVVMAGLRDFDVRLERASRSLGAGAVQTYALVVLPLLRRAIFVGLFFAFLVSFDELLIARAVTQVDSATLPIRLWNGAREEISPALAVVSTLGISITLLATGTAFALRKQLARSGATE